MINQQAKPAYNDPRSPIPDPRSLLGVVFTGGESPSPSVIRKILKNETPFIVAADSGLIAAEGAGINPDYIIGDMDSVENSRLTAYPPECVMRHDHDKDYTDTELALLKVFAKGCTEVWIIGGGGGRIDHLFGLKCLFEREIFPSRWITADNDIRCIDAKKNSRLSLMLKAGSAVSVFPAGAETGEAMSEGLKWKLDGLLWDRGFFGLSNVAVNGAFSITAVKGRFLIITNIEDNRGEHGGDK